MLFFGHIAISIAVADIADADAAASVAGNLLPDVVDKTGSWVLKLTPAGRWLAHGLPVFALVSLASRAVLSKRQWRGFVLGYGFHLVADLWAGGRLPLLAPFRLPDGGGTKRGVGWWLIYLAPEAGGIAYLSGRLRRRRPEIAVPAGR